MTLPFLLLTVLRGAPSPSPLVHRIFAAFRLEPVARRVTALALLHELYRAGAPTSETLRTWSQMGCLLTRCVMDLGEDPRAAHFARLARNVHDVWERALSEAEARQPMRRTSRVIDAVCT